MKSDWPFADLVSKFPELASWQPGFRCAKPVSGRGKWIRNSRGQERFGDVSLHADPAVSFGILLRHSWPAEVSPEEAAQLDEGLRKGLVGGFLGPSRQVECSLVVDAVGYWHEKTEPMVVALAASLALEDLLRKGGWWDEGPLPPPAMARRAG